MKGIDGKQKPTSRPKRRAKKHATKDSIPTTTLTQAAPAVPLLWLLHDAPQQEFPIPSLSFPR